MKLLIFTQRVDKENDILGFFHNWIEKIAARVDFLNVVCLYEGQHNLPSNVNVLSLGKEKKSSKIKQLFRFYKYIWKMRKEYDVVFVHMNPIYIFLGGLFWKIYGKKIYLWHNHQQGSFITNIGARMSEIAFHTSQFAFVSRFKNSKTMPAGIDTNMFRKDEKIKKIPNSILFIGRFSPVKKIELLIEAVKLLDKEGIDFTLNIAGEAEVNGEDYFKKIKDASRDLEKLGKVKFLGKIPNYKTPEIYGRNEVVVNLSPAGLFDKTILEAMACESISLVSSPAFRGLLPNELIFKDGDITDLKNKIINIFNLSVEEKNNLGNKLRQVVIEGHSLEILADKLVEEFEKKKS
jgi:glycosyltransferase involved in cell wall biosynthesis